MNNKIYYDKTMLTEEAFMELTLRKSWYEHNVYIQAIKCRFDIEPYTTYLTLINKKWNLKYWKYNLKQRLLFVNR